MVGSPYIVLESTDFVSEIVSKNISKSNKQTHFA